MISGFIVKLSHNIGLLASALTTPCDVSRSVGDKLIIDWRQLRYQSVSQYISRRDWGSD